MRRTNRLGQEMCYGCGRNPPPSGEELCRACQAGLDAREEFEGLLSTIRDDMQSVDERFRAIADCLEQLRNR